jgi:hypothetical protein
MRTVSIRVLSSLAALPIICIVGLGLLFYFHDSASQRLSVELGETRNFVVISPEPLRDVGSGLFIYTAVPTEYTNADPVIIVSASDYGFSRNETNGVIKAKQLFVRSHNGYNLVWVAIR